MSTTRQPRTMMPPPSPPRQRQWDTFLIGIAFGFGCGVFLTIGLVLLISGSNAAAQNQLPGNGGQVINTTPTATEKPTSTPTATFTPTPTPTPEPTPTATPDNSSAPTMGADDPRVYIALLIVFIILAAIMLARRK